MHLYQAKSASLSFALASVKEGRTILNPYTETHVWWGVGYLVEILLVGIKQGQLVLPEELVGAQQAIKEGTTGTETQQDIFWWYVCRNR